MKRLYLAKLIIFLVYVTYATCVSAQNYSYGNISWNDGKNEVINKMTSDSDYKFYAANPINKLIMQDLSSKSGPVKKELQTIYEYVKNKQGIKYLQVLGFDKRKFRVVSTIHTPSIFLFTHDDKLILQKFMFLNNAEIIKESIIKKYGKPTSVDSGFNDESIWETDERIVNLSFIPVLGAGFITYINKPLLSNTASLFNERYEDPHKVMKEKVQIKVGKF